MKLREARAKRFEEIELKLLLQVVIGGMFVAVGIAVVLLVHQHAREQALTEAESKARLILDRNLATHTYFTHQLKPHIFEWTEPIQDENYFDPVWMSSTYAVREIDKYFQSLNPADYYYKEAAINARMPANEADAYERQFLEQLNEDPELTERSLVRTLDGQPYFVMLRRGEVMEESCLRCHSTPDVAPNGLVDEYGSERSFHRELGDVVSAISIRVPLAEAYGEADRFAWRLSLLLLALLISLFLAQSWLGQRFFFAPVARVREKALQIADGKRRLGEQIPPSRGKELRDLTQAFNKMSQSLRCSYDQLEERVEERTTELKLSNERLEREIIDHKRTEQALQEHRARLEEMVEVRTQALRAAQERLLRREKLTMLGQLAGSIGHELRNPLGAIKNGAYFLQMALGDPEPEVQETLDILDEEIDRSEAIITGLLDFARTKTPERRPLSIRDIVEESLTHVDVPDSVDTVLQFDRPLPTILADPDQLDRVLVNLICNAIEAMPGGGQLVIEASEVSGRPPRSEQVVISITDTGEGIPQANREKIFEPLFSTKKDKGVGLGLALSRMIVEAHGGTIALVSEVGKGSTFTVKLPIDGESGVT